MKVARAHNGAKTVSSINGVGKSGLVKGKKEGRKGEKEGTNE